MILLFAANKKEKKKPPGSRGLMSSLVCVQETSQNDASAEMPVFWKKRTLWWRMANESCMKPDEGLSLKHTREAQ